MSLLAMYLPKLVLDAVEQQSNIIHMQQIIMVGIVFTMMTVINMIVHNLINSISQQFLFSRSISLWEKKAIHMDYQIFLSNKGKIAMEKARQVISSPKWGCVSFLQKVTDLAETAVGLVVYCAIAGSLHQMIILFLILKYTNLFYEEHAAGN